MGDILEQQDKPEKSDMKKRFSGAVRINPREDEPQFVFGTTGAISSFAVDPDWDAPDDDLCSYLK